MFSLILMPAAALALMSGSASVPSSNHVEPKITLTVQATSAVKALQQLAEAAHVTLLTSNQTAKEIITFRFVDVTLSDAKKRIAEAVDGTWKHEKDGDRLIRTSEQERREKKEELEFEFERMRKAVDDFTSHYKQLPAWDAQEADRFAQRIEAVLNGGSGNTRPRGLSEGLAAVEADGPINRLVGNVAMQIDPRDLASIQTHGKEVWSTGPTSVQHKMPESVMSAVRQFMQDQAIWSSAVANHLRAIPKVNGRAVAAGGLQQFVATANPKIGSILITAEKGAEQNGVWIMVDAYDEEGFTICHGQCSLGSDVPDDIDKFKTSQPIAGEDMITFSDEAKALWASQSSGGKEVLPPGLAAKIARPDQVDPLSLQLSPSLVRAAEIKKVNMVGCLPDEALRVVSWGTSEPTSVESYVKMLSFFATSVDIRNGWMVVKPSRPMANRENFADRQELGKYIQALASGKQLSLDEQARFALSLPDPDINFLPETIVELLPSSVDKTKLPDRDLLRFYGMATPDQKAAMLKDGLIMSGLSPGQTECLNRMVYGALKSVTHNDPSGNGPYSRDSSVYTMGLLHESTECLPNGIPATGVIRLKVDNSPVVLASRTPSREAVTSQEMTAPQLAFQKWSQDHPEAFDNPFSGPAYNFDMSHLRFGRHLHLAFTFQYTPVLLQRRVLEDKSVGDTRVMTINDLPEDFKKQFDEAYQAQEQKFANRPHPPAKNNNNIPPPPFGS